MHSELVNMSKQLLELKLWSTLLDRSMARLLVRSPDRSLDRSIARALDRSIAPSLAGTLVRSIARSNAPSLDRSLDRSIARSLAMSIVHAGTMIIVHAWHAFRFDNFSGEKVLPCFEIFPVAQFLASTWLPGSFCLVVAQFLASGQIHGFPTCVGATIRFVSARDPIVFLLRAYAIWGYRPNVRVPHEFCNTFHTHLRLKAVCRFLVRVQQYFVYNSEVTNLIIVLHSISAVFRIYIWGYTTYVCFPFDFWCI